MGGGGAIDLTAQMWRGPNETLNSDWAAKRSVIVASRNLVVLVLRLRVATGIDMGIDTLQLTWLFRPPPLPPIETSFAWSFFGGGGSDQH